MTKMVNLLSSEERHVRFITNSPIASIIIDPRLPDNPIIACNPVFSELTGYPPEEVVGRNCRFLSGPTTEQWPTDEIRCAVREHFPVFVEMLNYKRSGQPFRNGVLIAQICDEQNTLLYFLISLVEIDNNATALSNMHRIRAREVVKSLSPRQGQVLELVANGLLNKQIAGELGLAEKTVKMHRAILMSRLGFHTSASLIRLAVEAGL